MGAGNVEEAFNILPLSFEAEGCIVHLLEVLRSKNPDGTNEYHVVLKIQCNDIESKVFDLSVKNTRELKAKILAEITKLKLMVLVHGKEFARRVIG